MTDDGSGGPGRPPPADPSRDLRATPGLPVLTWRRLDPRMLLIHPVQAVIRFLPALVGLLLAGRIGGSGRGYLLEAGAVLVLVGYGISRWFTTRYRIDNGQIELRRGLFVRQVLATPADRIRTVDVTASPMHRLLGVAKVDVGTGSGAGNERIVLDALPAAEATRLRSELLHRRGPGTEAGAGVGTATGAQDPAPAAGSARPATRTGDSRQPAPPAAAQPDVAVETTLAQFDPRWTRYAPFTSAGVVAALAVWGVSMQYLPTVFGSRGASVRDLGDQLSRQPWWLLVPAAAALFAVVLVVLSAAGYLLGFWGFRLTRHPQGSLHTTRGLLTTRRTSIEEARIRGVEIGEPLGLRVAGARRLQVVTTGLRRSGDQAGGSLLVPPAPRDIVTAVAAQVVSDDVATTAPLRRHGPAARRRRLVRALLPAAVLGVALVVTGWIRDWPVALLAVALLLMLVSALLLAADRYAGLGHVLTDRHLVVRSGSLARRRDIVQRRGVVGLQWRQTFFQRRAGLATFTVTTAAGRHAYHAVDLDRARAVELGHAVDPALVRPFLAGPDESC